uniref:Uncharacterized protein n=1 Tax=Callorhinchus milii TaxID=7868 RepID=A0A4W3HET6_CALMI
MVRVRGGGRERGGGKRKNSESDDLDTDDQPELQSKRQRSESVSDHWDTAGLHWWFITSLQSNYGSSCAVL